MSGIAGILRFDGAPVSSDDLAAMTATMVDRGPDGINQWKTGPVGLAHCMLRTTAPSVIESQPFRAAVGDMCITMDGRVDNREELAGTLGVRLGSVADTGDAELVLRSYQRWGTDAIARIVGDFAFAIWDGTRRELICGRDFLGKRAFYYSSNRAAFRFASEPQAVMVDPSISREPNQGMVGEFLAVRVTSTSETLFQELFRLPPAHFMVVTPDRVRVSRYWDWDPETEIRGESDRDYAAQFVDVCAPAIEACLQSPWPVGVALSGGVDSSSLLGLIEQLRHAGRHDTDLDVFAMAYPGYACDESEYIHAVADALRLPVDEFRPAPVGAAPYEEQTRRYLDLSDYPATMTHRTYGAEASVRGCRALLTGKGPDEWLSGSCYSLADQLIRRQLGGLLGEIRTGAGSSDPRDMARHLMRYGVAPLLPAAVLNPIRSALGHDSYRTYLRPSFCRATHLDERVRTPIGRHPTAASAAVAANLSDGWQAHANELTDRLMASMRLEARDPFDDRRVVEFALALPEEQRRKDGVAKQVLRQAVTGLIPESVRTRPDTADYAHLICEELRLQGGSALFADLELSERGWVDGQRVRAMYHGLERDYREGNPAYHRHAWSLWLIVAVERWLRVTL